MIEIPNFSNEIFFKWVIVDDFILRNDTEIIWRNIVFKESIK